VQRLARFCWWGIRASSEQCGKIGKARMLRRLRKGVALMDPSRFSFQRPGNENYAPLHQDVFIFFVQVSPKPMSVHWKGEIRNLTCLQCNSVLVIFHPLLSRPRCNREWNVQRNEATTLRILRRRSTRSRRNLSITSHPTRSVKSKRGFQRPV